MKRILAAAVILLAFASPVLAVPALQLDISGGTYDTISQSIVTSAGDFTLYALLKPDKFAGLGDTYFISIAVEPRLAVDQGQALGSFSIDGHNVDVTSGMTWGTPPISAVDDLASHGAFPTYFLEYQFSFNSTDRAVEYNSMTSPGGFVADPNGSLYYAAFNIEGAYLSGGYGLHFDLYNVESNGTISRFAPFTHDAGTTNVPEPNSLLLLGVGLVGLVGMRKRFF